MASHTNPGKYMCPCTGSMTIFPGRDRPNVRASSSAGNVGFWYASWDIVANPSSSSSKSSPARAG